MARDMTWRLVLGLFLAGCGTGSSTGDSNPSTGGGGGGGGGSTTPPKVQVGAPPSLSWVDTAQAFDDTFNAFDEARWRRSDGWADSSDFNAGWRADHVRYVDGQMLLQIDPDSCSDADPSACSDRPYASGELASNTFLGYGRYEVRMKPAKGAGLLTSFALSTGPFEDTQWDEIDISFLGSNTKHLQVNYIHQSSSVQHQTGVDLPFDAADDFHTYGIEWTRTAVHWYVDGKRIYSELGTNGALPNTPGRVLVNLWPGVGPSTEQWMGHFTYPGTPVVSAFEELRYSPATPLQVIEDFDSADTEANWTLPEFKASTNIYQREGHLGSAIYVGYSPSSSSRAGAGRLFDSPQDWSRGRYLDFWFFGAATGDSFRVELLDNGADASSSERFEYRLTDDTIGWKWMSVPLGSFTRRTDWQPSGAPKDGLTLTSVHGLIFEALSGSGHAIRLDDIVLEQ